MYNSMELPFDRILMDGISDLVFVVKVNADSEFIYEFLNRAAMEGTGLTPNILGKSFQEVFPEESAAILIEQYNKVVAAKECVVYKDYYISPNGEKCYSETKLTPLFDSLKNCKFIVAVVKNISKERWNDLEKIEKLTIKYEESEELFRTIAEHAHDLITFLDHKGKIIYVSPSYKEILGHNPSEYLGKFFLHNVHPDDKTRVGEEFIQSIKNGVPITVQFKQLNFKNEAVWSEAHGTPIFDNQKKFKHMVVLTRDITLQKEYESKLKYFAFHDPLTCLPNRRLFKEQLIKALKDLQEKHDGLAVIMMDIDHFKSINDQFGHDIGDMVIVEFGKRMSEVIRECDIVARLGGDEFVILLPGIGTIENAVIIADKIKNSMQQPWNIEGNLLEVTISMGIAMAPTHCIDSYALLKTADIALYDAKLAGRNTYKFKSPLENCEKKTD